MTSALHLIAQKLRQQEDTDSLRDYTQQEISKLKEQMYKAHEEQITSITETVFSGLDYLIFFPCYVHDCYLYDISVIILLEMDD